MRKSFEQIVTSMRGLLSHFVESCMTRPLDVMMAAVLLLTLLSTYICCVEFAKVLYVGFCFDSYIVMCR